MLSRPVLTRLKQGTLHIRLFTTTCASLEKALPPRRKISDDEITEAFLKGTGPGGQKINKTSCAVQLKHIATGIVVKCQETRSREQNRKYARQILGEKLDSLEKGSESRMAIKAERARVKKASASKKARRKHRSVAEEKATRPGQEKVEDTDAAAVAGSSSSSYTDQKGPEEIHQNG